MAEIMEIGNDMKKSFEKITDKVVKKVKEKPVFFASLAGVTGLALYKLVNTTKADGNVSTYAYVPEGYDGYPTMSESMIDDYNSLLGGSSILGGSTGSSSMVGGTTSSGAVNGQGSSNVEDSYIYDKGYNDAYIRELESLNTNMVKEVEELEEKISTFERDALANELYTTSEGEVYNALGDLIFSETQTYKVLTGDSPAAQTQIALERQSNIEWRNGVIAQMQANSAAYANANSAEEKTALHSANQELAKGIGLTYNSSTGKWYNSDGSEAWEYSNSKNNTVTTGTSKPVSNTTGSSSYGGISYDKNTDYAALIKKAKSEGASQSTIDTLTAQRNAKIAGENLNPDGTKKTSTSSSSKSSSSSSSTTLNGQSVTKTVTKTSSGTTTTYRDSSGKVVAQNYSPKF